MDAFDLVVIGAGPGGYVAAIRAAQLGLRVAIVDKRGKWGGTCLNVGCIPSKTLLHATELLWTVQTEGKKLGIEGSLKANFSQIMRRKQQIVEEFHQGITALFKKNKITTFSGSAAFLSPQEVEIKNGGKSEKLSARHFLIATGSEPLSLPFLPLDEKQILSSTGALDLDVPPKDLLVIGAGVIGVELGSVYHRLGTRVQFIELMPKICPTFDHTLSEELLKSLTQQGMNFHLQHRVVSAKISPQEVLLEAENGERKRTHFSAEKVLVCMGRKPYTSHLALDKAKVQVNTKGQIEVNRAFQSSQPHILAIGDVIDGPMLAHKASEEGILAVEALVQKTHPLSYPLIPNIIYTAPEVASVGLTEEELQEKKVPYRAANFPMKVNSRAKCTGEEQGLMKIITHAETDRILGVHLIGTHASEIIGAAMVALSQRMKSEEFAALPWAHPTLSEGLKEAALAVHQRAIHR